MLRSYESRNKETISSFFGHNSTNNIYNLATNVSNGDKHRTLLLGKIQRYLII